MCSSDLTNRSSAVSSKAGGEKKSWHRVCACPVFLCLALCAHPHPHQFSQHFHEQHKHGRTHHVSSSAEACQAMTARSAYTLAWKSNPVSHGHANIDCMALACQLGDTKTMSQNPRFCLQAYFSSKNCRYISAGVSYVIYYSIV